MSEIQDSKPIAADFALEAEWLATVDANNSVLEKSTLIIKDDKILDILPTRQARQRYCAAEVVPLSEHLLIPGLINAHGHAAMSLLRGYADDLPLHTWLEDHIWPAESEFVSPEFVYDGSLVAIAEMIATGTTCFADMYFFPEATARAVQSSGIRAYLAPPVFDFPNNWTTSADESLQAIEGLAAETRDMPLITTAIGPHAPYTVSCESFSNIVNAKHQHRCGVQVHCHETETEIEGSLKEHGQRPLARLAELGLIDQDTQLVHMTQVNDEDLATLEKHRPSIVHCPKSNLKLASGFSPVQTFLDRGLNVALGTDGAASNNSLDMFSEMQYAALLAKAVSGNVSAVDAATALRMATINGAKALGLDNITGSLEVGKQADIVAINMRNPHQWPLYSPLSALVYTLGSPRVNEVWIAGKRAVKNGTLLNFEQSTLVNIQRKWHQKLTEFQNTQQRA